MIPEYNELLKAAKEALNELEETRSDKPGYYADPQQRERLREAIKNASEVNDNDIKFLRDIRTEVEEIAQLTMKLELKLYNALSDAKEVKQYV